LTANLSAYPRLETKETILEALYNLSLSELQQDKRSDGAYNAGASWEGVWTRDVSYSTLLSLAALDPKGAKVSLSEKVKDGRIVQDTGTGGSWPCSSDRVTWGLAAWEIYLVTGDQEWLKESYAVLRASIEDDEHVVFDPADGLMRGESTFEDWREQTYPRWMQPADIYSSKNLGTNAVYYRVFQILAAMEKEQGGSGLLWEKKAEALRMAINRHFWSEEHGYYGQYLYGRIGLSLSPRADALGEALAMLFGIAPSERQNRILRGEPVMEYGVPTVYPETPGIEPYHNRSVWPFVQACWTLAAAGRGNQAAVLYGIATIERAAALFLTNKENFVADTGNATGTAINSDRQLWSVAANLAIFHRILFGISYEPDGLHFHPVVPQSLAGTRKLEGVRYREALLAITVHGYGSRITRFTLDGQESAPFVSPRLQGRHRVEIFLDNRQELAQVLHLVKNATAPETPQVHLKPGEVAWQPIPGVAGYVQRRNGQTMNLMPAASVPVAAGNTTGEVQIAARNAEGYESFLSEPVETGPQPLRIPVRQNFVGVNTKAFVILDFTHPNLQIEASISEDGRYVFSVEYANGNGPINTDNKCAIRTLVVDGEKKGPMVMPQRGQNAWDQWGQSNLLQINLRTGVHRFELRFDPYDRNMNGQVNEARIAAFLLRRIE
jgi:hypothetical protein